MKKTIYLSVICSMAIGANAQDLGTIDVVKKVDTKVIQDLNQQDIKSADLADALTKDSASISIQRRSGIANDIILRGQRKDNINITVDGGKIYGACPNRMDPPTSHIITSNIKDVAIIEGPYDEENFGTLSGAVKITTKKPSKKLSGEVNINGGSWGYKKFGATVSGGNDSVRVLVGASTQTSDQYKDGDGNTMAQQLKNATDGTANAKQQYKASEFDREAYTKKSFLSKIYIDINDNQELRLSYTGNRSDNVLYPSTGMDAISDDSDLYNLQYIVNNLGKYSQKLSFEYYYSTVDHPMTTQYRKSSSGAAGTVANVMSSSISGAKIKNEFNLNGAKITYGVDSSRRNWDGRYYKKYTTKPVALNKSIPDVDTTNSAIFASFSKKVNNFEYKTALRYDHTKIDPSNNDASKTYNDLSGYIFGYYLANDSLKYFVGVGKSIRVPDQKESHFRAKDLTGATAGKLVGNPNLKETQNYELDLGLVNDGDNGIFKTKVFYSKLKDFIVYNATAKQYQNVDAKLYGFSINGSYFATDKLTFDYGASYQRGKKDNPLAGQTDTNLPSIPPLKVNFGLTYDYDESLSLNANVVASAKWTNYDKDNGEQEIPSWSVLNLKASKDINKKFNFTFGIDNVFDKSYAVSNTYKDLTLVSGGNDVMLLNEPGRYIYANLRYKF